MTSLPRIRIDERSTRRLKLGYPWIFRSELIGAKEHATMAAGQLVDFVREKGDFVARGFFNPTPQLVGRVLTLKAHETIDKDFIHARLNCALAFRDRLYAEPFYRLIHAESDGFPGLVIDRYGDVLSCQVNTAGMDKLWPDIESALMAIIKPKAIVLKNDTASREQEGLELYTKVTYGKLAAGNIEIVENGIKFHVDIEDGQKTGWFFDQRDNRAWVAALACNKSLLDVYCHTGGFGITAAKLGAKTVTMVDSSAPALAMVKKNVQLNALDKICHWTEGKAFDVMEKLASEQKQFEVVAVDPPAFIKSRKDMSAGLKGYQKLAKLAEPLVVENGVLFFASCSHHASVHELADAVTEGLAKSGRRFQLIKVSGAAPDHPVHPLLPETEYLKGLTFKFMD